MDFNQVFRDRTKNFSISIIKSSLSYSDDLSIARKQIIRYVTSVTANYRAVSRAKSEKERFAKLCIVVEEIEELVKVMTKYKFKLSQNIKG